MFYPHFWKCIPTNVASFLAVQNSSIGDLVTDSLTYWLTHGTLLIDIQRATPEICDLWDIWLEWWGDMNWPKKRQWQRKRQRQWQRQWHRQRQWQWQTQNTFREHLQSAILETCDIWDIWSEWWGDMTWLTKRQCQRQTQRQRQRQREIHLKNTFRERS